MLKLLKCMKNRERWMILVMKDGDVIESGDHETLMTQGGFYYNLYQSQFDMDEKI